LAVVAVRLAVVAVRFAVLRADVDLRAEVAVPLTAALAALPVLAADRFALPAVRLAPFFAADALVRPERVADPFALRAASMTASVASELFSRT